MRAEPPHRRPRAASDASFASPQSRTSASSHGPQAPVDASARRLTQPEIPAHRAWISCLLACPVGRNILNGMVILIATEYSHGSSRLQKDSKHPRQGELLLPKSSKETNRGYPSNNQTTSSNDQYKHDPKENSIPIPSHTHPRSSAKPASLTKTEQRPHAKKKKPTPNHTPLFTRPLPQPRRRRGRGPHKM